MNRMQRTIATALCVLALFALSVPAVAEDQPSATAQTETSTTVQDETSTTATPSQTQQGVAVITRGGRSVSTPRVTTRGGSGKTVSVAKTELTDEQKAAVQQAQTAQDEAYKAYQAALVAAGILDQAELDASNRIVEQKQIASDIDKLQWTVEKYQAFNTLMKKRGADLQTGLAAFVSEGLLTQEQADALIVGNTSVRTIDYTNWTVGQVKELQSKSKTGAEYVAMINDLIEKGLLTQAEADALLSQQVSALGAGRTNRSVTAEQKEAWQAARDAYNASCTQINETLKAALTTTSESAADAQ